MLEGVVYVASPHGKLVGAASESSRQRNRGGIEAKEDLVRRFVCGRFDRVVNINSNMG